MDRHRRYQGPVRFAGQNREAVSRGAVGTAREGRGGAAYPREGTRAELPRRLRPLPAAGQVAGTGAVPACAFQNHRH